MVLFCVDDRLDLLDVGVTNDNIVEQLSEAKKTLHKGDVNAVKNKLKKLMRGKSLSAAQYNTISALAYALQDTAEKKDVIRIAILGEYTTQPIVTATRCSLLSEGLLAEIYEAPLGTYRQEILAADSELYKFIPDIIVIATHYHEIDIHLRVPMSRDEVNRTLELEIERWQALWSMLHKYLGKPVIQHLINEPREEFFGIAERRTEWSPSRVIEMLNNRLLSAAPSFVKWIDIERLAARVGRQNWYDKRLYYHGKFGFSPKFLPEYIVLLTASFRSVLGKTPKALIMDLDNTLWGGVVGDDGFNGIQLGSETPNGEAYQALCEYLKRLGQRGVILGVCSKNEISIATKVFENHPHMPLTMDDFSIVMCNWNDKASNLTQISEKLNIDVSAIVFIDDNPAECELVRQILPEILTIHMDGDPALFVSKIDDLHLFDSQEISDADLKRSKSYRARSQLGDLKAAAPNLESYLKSLKMRGLLWSASKEDLPRLAQMEIKTNQFNLTTRRWSSDQLAQFIEDENHDVFCFQLIDQFADHGLVGSVVVSYKNTEIKILSWLLSCRVFSRTCEEFILGEVVKRAQKRGIKSLVGEYIPTEKNKVVANLFARMGFVNSDNSGMFVMILPSSPLPKTYVYNNA